jgi:hypothetical protein
VPLTDEDITTAVAEAEKIIDHALPLGAVDPAYWPERRALRALAFTEVLRELLAQARVPQLAN